MAGGRTWWWRRSTARGRRRCLGRNNHQGSRSKKGTREGTRVATIFCSLIESAERCGVNPARYLRVVARAALRDPGVVILASDYTPDDDQDEAVSA